MISDYFAITGFINVQMRYRSIRRMFMDINRAKEIIFALAEGIDPTTGEILPEDSVCNKGEVVRAFYAILNVCGEYKETQKARAYFDTFILPLLFE